VRRRRGDLLLAAVLAAVCYIPLFLSRSGQVAADTKAYLYLDPSRLTASAASMWDPSTGLGTVTHQNIGYLFPMGPYYALIHGLGIPMWVGQRIWMGSLMFAAGMGVAYCARRLGLEGVGRAVAAFAYTLTPYTIDYLDRTSAILMPWSGLGWMIGFTALAARTGRWRYPAGFALVVALVGGVNATSILLVLLGPAWWLAHAAWVSREIPPRRAAVAGLRIGALSALVSLWWAAGLWAESAYGINVLRVTETIPTVSHTSSASEVLRGLGYWYFYGWDKVQPWTLPAVAYMRSLWLLALSLAVPVIAIGLGLVTRWRYRSFALGLVGLGTVIAVGAYPYDRPSWWGSLIKDLSAGSTLALAGRSVDRVVPLVVLGLALLMGMGVASIELRSPGIGAIAGVACLGLVAADLPPLWSGNMIASNLSRPSALPSYWTAATSYLNSLDPNTRVLGLPGEDFAAYAWGVTEDPIAAGLLTRGYVQRQVVPSGTPAAANLLQALDEPIQEGTLDTSALAPLARLMSVGQVLLQSDLQYERYHLPLPQALWLEMNPPPSGLTGPTTFGNPNVAPTIRYPLDSEARLGLPTGTPNPPALAAYDVSNPRPLIRTESPGQTLLLAGDGRGVVEAAGAGLLDGNPAILYAATASHDPTVLARAEQGQPTVVLTDTNALAVQTWGSLRDNVGEVQQPGVSPLAQNPSDYSVAMFPREGTSDQTVAEVSGIASVAATNYGDSLAFTPEDRPVNAVDGNPDTAWTFGARAPVGGTRLRINLRGPVTTDHIDLVQYQGLRSKRRIISVTLLFDGSQPVTVPVTKASVTRRGQTVRFSPRTFSRFDVVVNGATGGSDKNYDGLPAVGFDEIGIPGVSAASESLQLPTDILSALGPASLANPLDILLQRIRGIEPPRHDPEPNMSRTFDLPTTRTFTVSGTAEINYGDSDYLVNQLIGLTPQGPLPKPTPAGAPGPAEVVAANSSTRLDGDRSARANAAVDGDPSTSWIAETGPQAGEWLQFFLNKPVTFDHLDLQEVNDGRHSLPTRITITAGGAARTVAVPAPAVGTGRPQGSTSAVRVNFAALTGTSIKVTIDSVEEVKALDYYSEFAGIKDILPVGIAELGIPGLVQPPAPAFIPATCQRGLLTIDGKPVDVEITGSTGTALAGGQLALKACGNSTRGVTLTEGTHVLQTSPRLPTGWSIDQLWLGSAAGGGPSAALSGPTASTGEAQGVPPVHLDSQNRTSATVTVDGDGQPFWLVLGQSYSAGWSASTAGGKSLGSPTLIDGYANGWYVPAGAINGPTVVHLRWTPQTVVTLAIAVSAGGLALSLGLVIWPGVTEGFRRRRRGRRPEERRGVPAPEPVSWQAVMGTGGRRPSFAALLLAAVAWGLPVAFFARPLIGVIAAAAVASAAWWRWGRAGLRVALIGALVLLPVYDVQQQSTHHYLPTIDWVASLSSANDIAWLALSLVGTDLVAGRVRNRSARSVYAPLGMEVDS
jgi:hypothetical protein